MSPSSAPSRRALTRFAFTPAYVEIEATYLVPASSPIRTLEDVDRDGVRIATAARAAYTLYLQRTLRHATLVEADGIQGRSISSPARASTCWRA